jgi:hypothetical protein
MMSKNYSTLLEKLSKAKPAPTRKELKNRIAELEKELSSVVAGLFSEHDLAIRDLEQQAKALYDFEVNEDIGSVACDQIMQSLRDKCYELSNKAESLKDQG